ncbi:methionine ABC transporter substrate-binding protein [Clostridium tertium]|uniref:Lipoprotein n=1 Tax=Clostridium tertium TaxID=1559 RepID=A0A6N3BDR3_9CLOT
MKKRFLALALATVIAVVGLVGCGKKEVKTTEIKVGATTSPYGDILEFLVPILEEEGITLEPIIVDSSATLNDALKAGDIDANFFQHMPYLKEWSSKHDFEYYASEPVHLGPVGFYSSKIESIDELKDGATIAVSDDPSNLYRQLLLLDKQGVLEVTKGLDPTKVSLDSIKSNPKSLKFVEVPQAQIPRMLPDIDGGLIVASSALDAGLDVNKALFREEDAKDSIYSIVLVTKKGNEDNEAFKKLDEAIHSPEVKKFIEEKYKGAIIPAF